MKNEKWKMKNLVCSLLKKIVKIVCNYLVNKKLVANTNIVICDLIEWKILLQFSKNSLFIIAIIKNTPKKIENDHS